MKSIRIHFLSLILTLCASNVFAQSSFISSVGVNASPNIGFRTLTLTNGNEIETIIFNQRQMEEGVRSGYTIAIHAAHNFSSNLSFEVGLQYGRQGFSHDFPVRGNGIDLNPIIELKIDQNFDYAGLPIRFVYKSGKLDQPVSFISGLGVTPSVLQSSTETVRSILLDGQVERETHETNIPYKGFNLFAEWSVGVDMNLFGNLRFRIEPTIRYGIMPILKGNITTHLWNGGLNLGCYYTIHND